MKKENKETTSSVAGIAAAREKHAADMQATFGAAQLAHDELQAKAVSQENASQENASQEDQPVVAQSVSQEPISEGAQVTSDGVVTAEPDAGSVQGEAVAVDGVEKPRESRIAALARARLLGASEGSGVMSVRAAVASRTIGGMHGSVKEAIADRLSQRSRVNGPRRPKVIG